MIKFGFEYISIALFLALGACASPSPEFPQHPTLVHEENGLRYSVFSTRTKAQVIRTGYASRLRENEILNQMEHAVELATGCDFHAVRGDLNQMTGRLNC
jgi:hypothetical protein